MYYRDINVLFQRKQPFLKYMLIAKEEIFFRNYNGQFAFWVFQYDVFSPQLFSILFHEWFFSNEINNTVYYDIVYINTKISSIFWTVFFYHAVLYKDPLPISAVLSISSNIVCVPFLFASRRNFLNIHFLF